jgi:hypothetical protein
VTRRGIDLRFALGEPQAGGAPAIAAELVTDHHERSTTALAIAEVVAAGTQPSA